MTNISSYVDYLPPFLWSKETDSSQFLGRILRIYEKILTGIPDENSIVHSTHEHDNFENTIDELAKLFNPWNTNKDYLPWLSSWVALTLPKDFTEYQSRKIISEIVSIYQERGLKKGLHAYLDIYITEAKPRIVIDDGDAILRVTFLDTGTAVLHTVAHSSEVLEHPILIHPSAIAVDKENNYIVAEGDSNLSSPSELSKYMRPKLWKVSSNGEVEYKSINKIPVPQSVHEGEPLVKPIAVVVDKKNRISVLDVGKFPKGISSNSAIYRFDPTITKIIAQPAIYPVDMILDSSENFVVLDRGIYPIGENPGSQEKNNGQKIIVVSEGSSPNDPRIEEVIDLKEIVEPTALAMNSEGDFIVADSKDQNKSDPADLIIVDHIDRSETSLLDMLPDGKNPLIFPTGLAFETPHSLLVCDSGLRWGSGEEEENYRIIAEPAAIYRIDLSQPAQPTVTRVTSDRKLINPTKMIIDRKGKLIITDKGEFNETPPREWRAKANEFGISVFFSQQRPTSDEDRNRIRRGIENVINEQKPGHVTWWMKA